MKISEQAGRIVGLRFDSDGFQFEIDAVPIDGCGCSGSYFFPSSHMPKAFDFDDFRFKRVKITVEMEEE